YPFIPPSTAHSIKESAKTVARVAAPIGPVIGLAALGLVTLQSYSQARAAYMQEQAKIRASEFLRKQQLDYITASQEERANLADYRNQQLGFLETQERTLANIARNQQSNLESTHRLYEMTADEQARESAYKNMQIEYLENVRESVGL